MDFNTSDKQNCVVITIDGKVMGGPDAGSLNEKLHEFIEEGRTNFVVDLGDVKFMNSSGLGMLVGALTTTRKAGGDLRITNTTEKIENLLVTTKLITVFKHFKSLQDAIKSFADAE